MTLAALVREKNWSDLEQAWTEWALGEAGIEPALQALQAAADHKEIPRCLPFVREHAEVLIGSERAEGAAELLGAAMLLGGSPGELAKPLYRAAEAAWSEAEIWEDYTQLSGLDENAPDMRAAWKAFRKLLRLEPETVVYHAKGWGIGQIEARDPAASEVTVRFRSGRTDRFPYASAVDIFEVLEDHDLRTLLVRNPDELQRLLKEEPLDVLRWVLRRNKGRVQHAGIKLALGMLGIEGPRFTTWWRKARKSAETSEWFEVSGPASRVQVRLLAKALDPAEGIRRQLLRANDLGQGLIRAKSILSGGSQEENVRHAVLKTLGEMVADEGNSLRDRLSVWLFLREEEGATPELLVDRLTEAAEAPAPSDPSQAPALWELFQVTSGSREQERCIDLLQEVYPGDRWLAEAAEHLPHAAAGMARPLVDALAKSGQTDRLVKHYNTLLVRPTRNPAVLVSLGERLEDAQEDDALPPPIQRAQCLLQLAVHLHRNAPGNNVVIRVRNKLGDLLDRGETPLLKRMLASADRETFRSLITMVEGNIDPRIDRLFTRVAVQICPGVFKGDERPFWENEGIWTTRAGLAKHEAELRELRDVKIPANSEAIGKAASYGDLSENSEWEAAIEEQRNLTRRAMELEAEIRDAQLLEDAAIPADTVAPGTRVRYRDLTAGEERVVKILGPWDMDGTVEGEVSYRSPLAAGMLGCHPGDRADLELPSGEIQVEVLSVELLTLD